MKRFVTLIVIILYTSLLLVGCKNIASTAVKQDEKSYEYTVWSYAPYTDYLKDQVVAFNKKFPKVKINIEEVKKDTYINSFKSVINSSEKSPDMLLLTGQQLNDIYADNKKIFVDLSTDVNSRAKSFSNARVDEATVESKVYGFPWDSKPMILFCNNELLGKYNINLNDVTTWSSLIEVGKKFYNASGNKEYLLSLSPSDEKTLMKILLYQLGVPAEKLDMTSGNKDLTKVIDLMAELKKENVLKIDDKFDMYKSPVMFGSSDMYLNLEKLYSLGKISIKDLPAFEAGGNTSVIMEGVNATIINNGKNTDMLKQFLISALTDNTSLIKYMEANGVFPSYLDSYQTSEIDKKIPFLNYERLWAKMALIETNAMRKRYYYNMNKMIDSYIDTTNKLAVTQNNTVDLEANKATNQVNN